MIAYYTTQTFNSEDFSDIYPYYDIMLKKNQNTQHICYIMIPDALYNLDKEIN